MIINGLLKEAVDNPIINPADQALRTMALRKLNKPGNDNLDLGGWGSTAAERAPKVVSVAK